MSILYNKLKDNVDRINTHCKSGITFHENKTWTAPFDGDVTLFGHAAQTPARDCQLNETVVLKGMYSAGHIIYAPENDFDAKFNPNIYLNIYDSKSKLVKNKSYEIVFNNDGGWGIGTKFGEKTFTYRSIQYGEAYHAKIPITETTPLIDSPWLGNVGSVYRLTQKEEPFSPYFSGEFDFEIVAYDEAQHLVTCKIIKLYRQPSQNNPQIIPQYLTLKYVSDVMSIFSDTY